MCKVIVVEAEAMIAMDLAAIISSAGCQIEGMAASVPIALRLAEDKRPELAIVDALLQHHGDGLAVARELHRRWDIRSIVISHFGASELDGVAIVGWLCKPFHPQQLAFLIGKHKAPLLPRSVPQH